MTPQAPLPIQDSKLKFQPAKNERYVYPYSVIPGGVQSREELASVIASDPVVTEHYARFAVSQARIVHATDAQFVHVAYRLRNKVFWTAKKVRIPKGEALITDGTDLARTRCGNRVSAIPLEPVSEEEPAVETFEVPVLASVEAPELEMPPSSLEFDAVPTLQPYVPIQRPTILPYYYRPLFIVRQNDVIIPEPATLGLLSIGLATFLLIRFSRKR